MGVNPVILARIIGNILLFLKINLPISKLTITVARKKIRDISLTA